MQLYIERYIYMLSVSYLSIYCKSPTQSMQLYA